MASAGGRCKRRGGGAVGRLEAVKAGLEVGHSRDDSSSNNYYYSIC